MSTALTSTTETTAAAPSALPFRLFRVAVARTERLSPSFARVTFTGPDLDRFADNGYDQRIKLVLPLPERGLTDMVDRPDWYDAWRSLPDDRRNPIRTYTVRAVRAADREVDVDMVLHGDGGPASAFATSAGPGDEAVLIGPDADYPDRHGGVEFAPPGGYLGPLLIAGDETALPAIAAILERLDPDSFGRVVVEVPHPDDRLPLAAPAGLAVTWLVRSVEAYGERLVASLCDGDPVATAAADGPGDEELLWEVPGDATARTGDLYAWIAGEAGAVRRIRRHLVSGLGHDRRAVSFMGYWRSGVAGS